MRKRRALLTSGSALLLVLAVGCHKKAPPPPPPPPPANVAPTGNKPVINYFTAEPGTINSGQPSSLRWSVDNATNVQIDTVGQVSPNGRRAVYPTATTDYHLTATGPGGTTDATTTVTVSTAPPPAAVQGPTGPSAAEILARQVQDVHFDYDKSDIRAEDQPVLQSDANALKTIFSDGSELHRDDRGSL